MIDHEAGRGAAHAPILPVKSVSRRWNLPDTPSTLLPGLEPFAADRPDPAGRAARVARWLQLTREALPAAARVHRWPIRADHCFMRVCLDHALGTRWDRVVRRPAIHHLSDAQLDAAIRCAERLLADPAALFELNRRSLLLRQRR